MTQEMIYERQIQDLAIINVLEETLRLEEVLSLISKNDDNEDKSINTMPIRPQGKILF